MSQVISQVQPQYPAPAEAPPPLEILRADGSLAEGWESPMNPEQIQEALRWMVLSRTFDQRGFSLHRQGRFGTFSPVTGQEAAVVGSSLALDPQTDWIVPQYRELPALLRHGYPLDRFMMYFMGNPAGGQVPSEVKVLPIQISLAAQLPHATGLAWGLKLQGKDGVVMTYCGEGASSEGDFHEALNLAGVVKAPVVFILQNNGWAISTPRERQSATATFAQRAPGYGFPGILVDGNDLFAVYAAASEAVDRARSGEGPTLIEAKTYRLWAHNTADDPTRYVDPADLERWRQLDPISRVERYLERQGAWNEADQTALREEVDNEISRALETAWAAPEPNPMQLFDHVYAEAPPRLQRQRARAQQEMEG